MELVYPIYLDAPMLMTFLGSLKGGIAEEATIESKTQGTKEKELKAQIQAKISGMLSLVGIGGEADLCKKEVENLESQYKSTVRYPHAALFVQLRELLIEQKLIKTLDSSESLKSVSIGDIVEFQGLAVANPGYQIRHSYGQLLPAIESYLSWIESQLELQVILLNGTKPNKPVIIDGKERKFQDLKEINTARDTIKAQQQQMKSLASMLTSLNVIFSRLFPEDYIDNVLFKSSGFNAISRVYPVFARDKRIQDLLDGHWRCIGKVINKLDESEKYDLLKDAPISYFAKDQFSTYASLLNNENIKIEVTDSMVLGPAIIIAPLAIFT
jgi:hypothetical protein